MRQIRTRNRLSHAESIARRERRSLHKSPFLKTSVKKLGPLARQIAGKPLGEVMVQMRFSKKKAAKDVLKHLELARSQAIVKVGMGLGKGERGEEKLRRRGLEEVEQEDEGEGKKEQKKAEAVVVKDRYRKKRKIEDQSSIYVDQAWVGRGVYRRQIDYRARGKRNIMRNPETSITVLLKEERTRIREAKEQEEKKARKKVWGNLPDRPVTAQRHYMLW